MTDADRLLTLLREAGSSGVHTHDIRRMGVSGNPSQRAADLEARGHKVIRIRENRGKRPGSRFVLVGVGTATPLSREASKQGVSLGISGVDSSENVLTGVDAGGDSPPTSPASVDPGVDGEGSRDGEPALPARLFPDEPQRPLSAFTDSEVA